MFPLYCGPKIARHSSVPSPASGGLEGALSVDFGFTSLLASFVAFFNHNTDKSPS